MHNYPPPVIYLHRFVTDNSRWEEQLRMAPLYRYADMSIVEVVRLVSETIFLPDRPEYIAFGLPSPLESGQQDLLSSLANNSMIVVKIDRQRSELTLESSGKTFSYGEEDSPLTLNLLTKLVHDSLLGLVAGQAGGISPGGSIINRCKWRFYSFGLDARN